MELCDGGDFAGFDAFVVGRRERFRGHRPGFAERFKRVGREFSERIGARRCFGGGFGFLLGISSVARVWRWRQRVGPRHDVAIEVVVLAKERDARFPTPQAVFSGRHGIAVLWVLVLGATPRLEPDGRDAALASRGGQGGVLLRYGREEDGLGLAAAAVAA